jgi:hypothetical protein
VQGKIVACDFQKSLEATNEVKAKGGVGVILFQSRGNIRITVVYGFPAIYLWSPEQAAKLSTYLQRNQANGTAALTPGGDGSSVPGLPTLANFSSFGPDQMHRGVQKPDVLAPGTDILAAVSPPGNRGRDYDVYSGTSMASPYVAGVTAVLRALHPTWSPSAVASALKTTATDTVGSNDTLRQGSGMVNPSRANDPGLVAVAPDADFVAFKESTDPDGRDLNLPYIALREYDGTRPVTLTRRFTNLTGTAETYRATVTGLTGMQVTVNPSSITVPANGTASVTITLNRGTSAFDRYVTGAITWAGSTHTVRVTAAARPWGFNPRTYDEIIPQYGWTGQAGQGVVQPGFTGPVTLRTTGYTRVPWSESSVPAPYANTLFDINGDNVRSFPITVPSGTAGLIVQIQPVTTGDDNLDVYLYRNGKPVDIGNWEWTSEDQAVAFQPAAGSYTAYVHARRASTTTVRFRYAATILPRTAQYNNATVRLLDDQGNQVSSVTRGGFYLADVRPRTTLPDVQHWSYVELTTGGVTIPGPLVSSR